MKNAIQSPVIDARSLLIMPTSVLRLPALVAGAWPGLPQTWTIRSQQRIRRPQQRRLAVLVVRAQGEVHVELLLRGQIAGVSLTGARADLGELAAAVRLVAKRYHPLLAAAEYFGSIGQPFLTPSIGA